MRVKGVTHKVGAPFFSFRYCVGSTLDSSLTPHAANDRFSFGYPVGCQPAQGIPVPGCGSWLPCATPRGGLD